ncbi:MAG: hypothetical protein Q4E61_04365 [Alphaproteobacteria bacterium]|nr:hypothetical protein [Alphaproteobacteria bacterium]
MNKFGKLNIFAFLFSVISFSFNNMGFSATPAPPKPTYDFKVNGHEYNLVGRVFKYTLTTSGKSKPSFIPINATDLKDYLVSTGNVCFQELGRLISKQGGGAFSSLLVSLRQHMLSHGHMGYYPVFSSYEGIVSSLLPRGIFNINLECKKRIAFDQYKKLSDMLATLQRDRDQASIVDLPNLLPLSITTRFSLSTPRDYPTLDPLFKKNATSIVNPDLMPKPSYGAKSLEQIADEIIKWVFRQSVTTPVFANDLSDNTKFSIKATLPTAPTGDDLIFGIISGEHIGNVKTKTGGFSNTDKVLVGIQVRDDGRIIITSLYPIE